MASGCDADQLVIAPPRFGDDPSISKDAYTAAFDISSRRVCTVAAYLTFRFVKAGAILPFTATPIDATDTALKTLTPGNTYQVNVDITGGWLGGKDVCHHPVVADSICVSNPVGAGAVTVPNTRRYVSGGPLLVKGLVICTNSQVIQREFDP